VLQVVSTREVWAITTKSLDTYRTLHPRRNTNADTTTTATILVALSLNGDEKHPSLAMWKRLKKLKRKLFFVSTFNHQANLARGP
jgi:hypothetical protein